MTNNEMPKDYKQAIETLCKIVTEFEAREYGNNCIVEEFIGVGWVDLCNKGIKMFEYLRDT